MTQKPDDLLLSATRALRDETAHDSSAARFTRLRVMASLRESEVRRRTQTVLLLPFAACLAVASAWGMAVGGISEMRSAVVEALGIDAPPAEPKAPAPPKARQRRTPSLTPAPSAAPAEPPPSEAPVPDAPAPVPTSALTPPAPGPAPSPVRPVFSAHPASLDNAIPRKSAVSSLAAARGAFARDAAHELYRTAHRAHFSEHDWDRALSAWDAYLAAAPRGGLVVEARYNRALCLVRLGRTPEARRALESFAKSAGGYRQKEASALLAVLAEN